METRQLEIDLRSISLFQLFSEVARLASLAPDPIVVDIKESTNWNKIVEVKFVFLREIMLVTKSTEEFCGSGVDFVRAALILAARHPQEDARKLWDTTANWALSVLSNAAGTEVRIPIEPVPYGTMADACAVLSQWFQVVGRLNFAVGTGAIASSPEGITLPKQVVQKRFQFAAQLIGQFMGDFGVLIDAMVPA